MFCCLAFVLILLCFPQVPCRRPSEDGVAHLFLSMLGCLSTLAWSHTENQESQVWGRWERDQKLSGVVGQTPRLMGKVGQPGGIHKPWELPALSGWNLKSKLQEAFGPGCL